MKPENSRSLGPENLLRMWSRKVVLHRSSVEGSWDLVISYNGLITLLISGGTPFKPLGGIIGRNIGQLKVAT